MHTSHQIGFNRLFFAWRPPQVVLDAISSFRTDNIDVANIRWVPFENYHLTQFFVGNVSDHHMKLISKEAKEALNNITSFELKVEAFELRGKPSRPSMIWLRFNTSKPFNNLYNTLKNLTSSYCKFQTEFQNPIPHITIARLGRRFVKEKIILPPITDFQTVGIDKCELWLSEKKDNKIKYSSITSWNFVGYLSF